MHNHCNRTKKVSYAVDDFAQLYERCFTDSTSGLEENNVVSRGKRIDHMMKELQCTNNYPSIDEFHKYENYLLNLGCGMKTQ